MVLSLWDQDAAQPLMLSFLFASILYLFVLYLDTPSKFLQIVLSSVHKVEYGKDSQRCYNRKRNIFCSFVFCNMLTTMEHGGRCWASLMDLWLVHRIPQSERYCSWFNIWLLPWIYKHFLKGAPHFYFSIGLINSVAFPG